jgi:hypothetical protein
VNIEAILQPNLQIFSEDQKINLNKASRRASNIFFCVEFQPVVDLYVIIKQTVCFMNLGKLYLLMAVRF